VAGKPDGGYFDDSTPPFRIGVLPMPLVEVVGASASGNGIQGHYISARTENVPACWEWLKFLSVQPMAFDGVPARLSITESPGWEAGVGAEEAEVYRLARFRVSESGGNETISDPVIRPFYLWRDEAVLATAEGADIHKVLTEIQQKADGYLGCIAKYTATNLDGVEIFNKRVIPCLNDIDPEMVREYWP
jgi:ABC-type glycerol-3-phosphate transport system substrate-binding protein